MQITNQKIQIPQQEVAKLKYIISFLSVYSALKRVPLIILLLLSIASNSQNELITKGRYTKFIFYDIKKYNGDTLIACGSTWSRASLFLSFDNGTTWDSARAYNNPVISSLYIHNKDSVFIGSSNNLKESESEVYLLNGKLDSLYAFNLKKLRLDAIKKIQLIDKTLYVATYRGFYRVLQTDTCINEINFKHIFGTPDSLSIKRVKQKRSFFEQINDTLLIVSQNTDIGIYNTKTNSIIHSIDYSNKIKYDSNLNSCSVNSMVIKENKLFFSNDLNIFEATIDSSWSIVNLKIIGDYPVITNLNYRYPNFIISTYYNKVYVSDFHGNVQSIIVNSPIRKTLFLNKYYYVLTEKGIKKYEKL